MDRSLHDQERPARAQSPLHFRAQIRPPVPVIWTHRGEDGQLPGASRSESVQEQELPEAGSYRSRHPSLTQHEDAQALP